MWLKTKDILNRYEINRKNLEPLIRDIHKRKPSYGYHRINVIIRREAGWIVSDNLVHKVCKILKIRRVILLASQSCVGYITFYAVYMTGFDL